MGLFDVRGLFGGGGEGSSSHLLDEQIRQNRSEMAQKAKNLFQTRLDIIKGAGAQIWEPMKPIKDIKKAAKSIYG